MTLRVTREGKMAIGVLALVGAFLVASPWFIEVRPAPPEEKPGEVPLPRWMARWLDAGADANAEDAR
jgi:hypothetical protein